MALTYSDAVQYLRRAYENSRLAHAYLISGSPGSGKHQLATEIANTVSGQTVPDIFAAPPPGIYLAEPESKSRRIVIEQVRTLEHALQMRSTDGRRKVAILVDADRLMPQAANAFLKTLEEPPNDSLLLLLTTMPEALPDTILSRCIAVPLVSAETTTPSPEEKELVVLLGTSGASEGGGVLHAYRMARRLVSLLARIRETIRQEIDQAFDRDKLRYKQTTDGKWLKEREEYYDALTESRYARQRARLIETLLRWWTDVLRARTGISRREFSGATRFTQVVAEKLSTAEILRRIRRIEEMREQLGRNVQESLVIEVAFLSVFTF